MQLKPEYEASYKTFKARGQGDVYMEGLTGFAEDWATAMEERIAKGASVEEAAAQTIDCIGRPYQLSFLMFACAYQRLCMAWVHGEGLKVWGRKRYPDVEV